MGLITKTFIGSFAAAIMMYSAIYDAEAAGKGKGQMLRDGLGAGSSSQ